MLLAATTSTSNPVGNELFRGIGDNTMSTRCFDEHVAPWQGIDFDNIPDAQWPDAGPVTYLEAEKYKNTIRAAHKQWGLTSDQVQSLVDMLKILTDTNPIPFHWPADGIVVLPQPTPVESKALNGPLLLEEEEPLEPEA